MKGSLFSEKMSEKMQFKNHLTVTTIFLLTLTCKTICGNDALSTVGVKYDNRCIRQDRPWMEFSSNCSIDKNVNPNVILIGYLGYFDVIDGFGKLISGAIPEAIERINNNPKILPNQVLRYVTVDDSRDPHWSPMRSMTVMRDIGVTAFVGLEQSCEKEASLAAAFNMALVSYRCADAVVSDKKKYPTFARTLPPASKISSALLSTIINFEWKQIIILADNYSSDYKEIEDAFKNDVKNYNKVHKDTSEEIKVTAIYSIPDDYVTIDNSQLERIVLESYEKTRIYIFLGDYHPLIGFAMILKNVTRSAFDDYVILAAEKDEMYNEKNFQQYCLREYDNKILEGHDKNMTSLEVYNLTRESEQMSACSSILILAPTPENAEVYDDFVGKVWEQNQKFPIKIPLPPKGVIADSVQMPMYAALAYDAVNVLARALHQVINVDKKRKGQGDLIVRAMMDMQYESILGPNQTMDKNADADGHYALLSLQRQPVKKMKPVARFIKSNCTRVGTICIPKFQYLESMKIQWKTSDMRPPKDSPFCGFENERCNHDLNWKMITAVVVCCCIMIICFVFVFKHYRYEQKLAALLWKIDVKDVIIPRTNSEYTLQQLRSSVNFPNVDWTRFASYANAVKPGYDVESIQHGNENGAGFFKGNVVFVKRINKKNIDLTRNLRKELIQVKELRHENINPFIGASVESPNICILTLYCARGSLEDILANEDITMDQMFIASLVADLIKGMIYLHDSVIGSHGNLKSSNCLVDSRWVLQISDFGLHEFKAGQDVTRENEERHLKGLLWRAPELLRMMSPPPQGTQKGDVYSFAIMLYEISGRKGPWATDLPIKNILDKVTNAQYEVRPFRPPLDKLSTCHPCVIKTLEECWTESPESRPDFRFINILLRDLQSGLKPNIFDNMISIMERYASNLEDTVKERTEQLMKEKKRTEMLLLRMLPKTVADQLTRGEPVEPISFNSVTIYFSDIVGFTELSAESTPFEVVDLLNDLYTCFDSIIENYDVYKVETIGDAYMVVSGLPQQNGDKHAGEVASMALHLLSEIQHFEIRHRPKERLKLRIGIHSGQCVAGVVGHKMPRYCLFGDTVCTASRMESTGEALKIHVSEACKNILENLGGYILQERGDVYIKGKGNMRTHWLIGKQSRKAGNNAFKQLNGRHKLNDLSNGFPPNNGKGSSRLINKNTFMFNGLNKNVVTRTSSLGDESSTIGTNHRAFLNQAFDHASESDTDENDEHKSLNVSRDDGQRNHSVVDVETSLIRGVARGSMKMPRKFQKVKRGSNFNNMTKNTVSAFC